MIETNHSLSQAIVLDFPSVILICFDIRTANPEFQNAMDKSARGERRVNVRENNENLIEPGDFKNRPHILLQTGEKKPSSVRFHVLHPFDQDGESGTIDVSDACEIDHQARGF